jgi:hypothetical protein
VLPYWAIYRRLDYICEPLATKKLSLLLFISASYILGDIAFCLNGTVFGKITNSNQVKAKDFFNFCFQFSLNQYSGSCLMQSQLVLSAAYCSQIS